MGGAGRPAPVLQRETFPVPIDPIVQRLDFLSDLTLVANIELGHEPSFQTAHGVRECRQILGHLAPELAPREQLRRLRRMCSPV